MLRKVERWSGEKALKERWKGEKRETSTQNLQRNNVARATCCISYFAAFSLDNLHPIGQLREKRYPILDPNAVIYIPYARVNCLKTIPFTAAHSYIP